MSRRMFTDSSTSAPSATDVEYNPLVLTPKHQINLQDISLQTSEENFNINPIIHEEKFQNNHSKRKMLKESLPEHSTLVYNVSEDITSTKKTTDKQESHSKKKFLKEPIEKDYTNKVRNTRCKALKASTSAPFPVQCDLKGLFLPTQCHGINCWCVDEAGNQLPNSETFIRGGKGCVHTPIEAVDVELGLRGNLHTDLLGGLPRQLSDLVERLGGSLVHTDPLEANTHTEGVTIHFQIVGENKVDVAYQLEEMVKSHQLSISPDSESPDLSPLIGDITRSRFRHLSSPLNEQIIQEQFLADRSIGLSNSHGDELSVSPLQTAVFVLATASAFLVGVFVVFIMLYRGKISRNAENSSQKSTDLGERFLAYSSPVYVLSPAEVQQTKAVV